MIYETLLEEMTLIVFFMNIFLSWSGEVSKAMALEFNKWIKFIFPEVNTWMSDASIEAGAHWGEELDEQLQKTHFGIVFLTQENRTAPWLLFEAGALSKSIEKGRVVPYCIGFRPAEVAGPLARFQSVATDKEGTFKIGEAINALLDVKRSDEVLVRTMEKWWPDLEKAFAPLLSLAAREKESVLVRKILCVATKQFEQLGFEQDLAVLHSCYPNIVEVLHDAGSQDFCNALINGTFEIVHLLGYVDTSSGSLVFGEEKPLSPEALLQLLLQAKTKMVFLASCDSLLLAAKLARHLSVVSATDAITVSQMVHWEKLFYQCLSRGISLAKAYDIAQVTVDAPMMLLIRNDALFLPDN